MGQGLREERLHRQRFSEPALYWRGAEALFHDGQEHGHLPRAVAHTAEQG